MKTKNPIEKIKKHNKTDNENTTTKLKKPQHWNVEKNTKA